MGAFFHLVIMLYSCPKEWFQVSVAWKKKIYDYAQAALNLQSSDLHSINLMFTGVC